MTLESRNRIAELEGWYQVLVADHERGGSVRRWTHADKDYVLNDCPIPDTLDAAAKLPEGWEWWRIEEIAKCRVPWICHARLNPKKPVVLCESGATEKEARFALRLAVLEYEKANP